MRDSQCVGWGDGVELWWHFQFGEKQGKQGQPRRRSCNMVQHSDLGYPGWVQQPSSTSNVQNMRASRSTPCLLALYNVSFFPKSLGHSLYWSHSISLINLHCIVTNLYDVKPTWCEFKAVLKSGIHFDEQTIANPYQRSVINPVREPQLWDSFYTLPLQFLKS